MLQQMRENTLKAAGVHSQLYSNIVFRLARNDIVCFDFTYSSAFVRQNVLF